MPTGQQAEFADAVSGHDLVQETAPVVAFRIFRPGLQAAADQEIQGIAGVTLLHQPFAAGQVLDVQFVQHGIVDGEFHLEIRPERIENSSCQTF